MNVQKLEENIYYYTDIFSDVSAYKLLIDEYSLDWHDWLSSDGAIEYGTYAGGPHQLPNAILDPIKYVTHTCLENYTENTGIKFGWLPDFYKIQKYSTGAYMGPHVDSIDKTADKSPTISIVLYLNEDYEGGNICFPEQGLDIKPKAGSMIIFPSYPPYYHDPKPVTKGTKYMCPIFCFKEPF
jgi:hypothetical protein